MYGLVIAIVCDLILAILQFRYRKDKHIASFDWLVDNLHPNYTNSHLLYSSVQLLSGSSPTTKH